MIANNVVNGPFELALSGLQERRASVAKVAAFAPVFTALLWPLYGGDSYLIILSLSSAGSLLGYVIFLRYLRGLAVLELRHAYLARFVMVICVLGTLVPTVVALHRALHILAYNIEGDERFAADLGTILRVVSISALSMLLLALMTVRRSLEPFLRFLRAITLSKREEVSVMELDIAYGRPTRRVSGAVSSAASISVRRRWRNQSSCRSSCSRLSSSVAPSFSMHSSGSSWKPASCGVLGKAVRCLKVRPTADLGAYALPRVRIPDRSRS